MKIKINRKQFLDVVNSIGRITSSKNTMPVMQNVKVEFRKDGYAVVTATDAWLSAMRKFKVADSFEEELSFCVNPKDMANSLKSIRDEAVTLDIGDHNCIINHAKGQMSLPALEDECFPMIEFENDSTKVTIGAGQLFNWLKNGIGFASNEEFRPILNGVHLYIKDGEVGVCATNSRVMYAENVTSDEYPDVDVNATVTTKAIATLLDIISGEEKVIVYFGKGKMTFRTETAMLTCLRVEGNYPDFKRIIRKQDAITAYVDKNDFVDSVSRATLYANSTAQLVKVNVTKDKISLDSDDLDFAKKSHDEVACEAQGGEILIGANGPNIIDCLRVIKSDRVKMGFQNERTAINIYDEDNPNKVIVIMPILIN